MLKKSINSFDMYFFIGLFSRVCYMVKNRKQSITTQPPEPIQIKKCKCDEVIKQIDLIYEFIASIEKKLIILEEKINKINITPTSGQSLITPRAKTCTPPPLHNLEIIHVRSESNESIKQLPSDDSLMQDFNKAQEEEDEKNEIKKKYWIF